MTPKQASIFFGAGCLMAAAIGGDPLWAGCPLWLNGVLSCMVGAGAAALLGGDS